MEETDDKPSLDVDRADVSTTLPGISVRAIDTDTLARLRNTTGQRRRMNAAILNRALNRLLVVYGNARAKILSIQHAQPYFLSGRRWFVKPDECEGSMASNAPSAMRFYVSDKRHTTVNRAHVRIVLTGLRSSLTAIPVCESQIVP